MLGYTGLKRNASSLVIGVLLLGCAKANPRPLASGLTVKQFVEVYVALRQAQIAARTPAEFETAKQKVLQQAGVSEETLEQFIAEHAGEVNMMANVWDTIANRLTNAPSLDTPI